MTSHKTKPLTSNVGVTYIRLIGYKISVNRRVNHFIDLGRGLDLQPRLAIDVQLV